MIICSYAWGSYRRESQRGGRGGKKEPLSGPSGVDGPRGAITDRALPVSFIFIFYQRILSRQSCRIKALGILIIAMHLTSQNESSTIFGSTYLYMCDNRILHAYIADHPFEPTAEAFAYAD